MLKNFKNTRMIVGMISLMSIMGLSGCSSSSDNTKESVEIANTTSEKINLTMWHYYNGSTKDTLDNMITEFNETVGTEKNIFVDAYSYGSVNDLATALVASANKEIGMENMPNIFAAYADTALLLDDIGVVAPMDDYFSESELEMYRSDFLEEGRFDSEGSLKILPVAKSTEFVFINDTDFKVFSDEMEIDINTLTTWESLAEVASIYYDWTDSQTEEENDGRALFGLDSEANFMILASKQLGEEIYDYSGEKITFGLSRDGAKKIWDNYIVPYIKGHYVSHGSFRSDDIKSGDLLMYLGSASSIYYFPDVVELGRNESYEITGTTIPYPYFEGEEKIVVQQGAGMLISNTGEDYESAASVEFLKWFTAPENNLEFAVSTGYMPVQNEALNYERVEEVVTDLTEGEVTKIVISSIDTTYNKMLPEYTFYSNRPFNGSYDTRNAIRDYTINTLEIAKEELENQLELGVEREEALNNLTSDENFNVWYDGFETTINDILANY